MLPGRAAWRARAAAIALACLLSGTQGARELLQAGAPSKDGPGVLAPARALAAGAAGSPGPAPVAGLPADRAPAPAPLSYAGGRPVPAAGAPAAGAPAPAVSAGAGGSPAPGRATVAPAPAPAADAPAATVPAPRPSAGTGAGDAMAPVGAPAPAPSAAARDSAAPAASGAMASAPAPAMPADAAGSPAPSADAPAASAPAPLAGARSGATAPAPAPMQEAAVPGPDGGSMAAMPQAPSPSPGSTPVYAAFINMRRAPAAAGGPGPAVAAPAPALDAAAAAPGPSAGAPAVADIMNTLIAKAGAFIDDKTLFLAGVDDSTLWSIDAPAGRRTGRFATADFVGDSLADWDSRPQAVLHAIPKGATRASTWAVELAHPRWNASAQTLKFSVEVLPEQADARLPGGAVAYALANADHSLVTEARPGAVFSDPVLFIDDSTTAADTTPAPEAAPAATGTTKSALVPLSGGSQHINLSGANTGTLHPQTPVAGAAQARGAGGGGGGGSGANRGLVHSGSATVNSLGHLGRTAFCPQLGWVYKSDPYGCNPVGRK